MSSVMKSPSRSKAVATSKVKKELSTVSRYELEQESRKRAFQEQKDAVSVLQVMPYINKKGEAETPSGKGLMMQFNKKVKEILGYSCEEIDQIQDVFLCVVIRNLRDEFTQIAKDYTERWDSTMEMYAEMKKVLWLLPEIAKENLNNKMNRIKKAQK